MSQTTVKMLSEWFGTQPCSNRKTPAYLSFILDLSYVIVTYCPADVYLWSKIRLKGKTILLEIGLSIVPLIKKEMGLEEGGENKND